MHEPSYIDKDTSFLIISQLITMTNKSSSALQGYAVHNTQQENPH